MNNSPQCQNYDKKKTWSEQSFFSENKLGLRHDRIGTRLHNGQLIGHFQLLHFPTQLVTRFCFYIKETLSR